jgi:hypothetical protein
VMGVEMIGLDTPSQRPLDLGCQLAPEIIAAHGPQGEPPEKHAKHEELAGGVDQRRNLLGGAERPASRERQVEPEAEIRTDRGSRQSVLG